MHFVDSKTKKEQKGKKQVRKRPSAVARWTEKNVQAVENVNCYLVNEGISYDLYMLLGS